MGRRGRASVTWAWGSVGAWACIGWLGCSFGDRSYLRDESCAPECGGEGGAGTDGAPVVDGSAIDCPVGKGPNMIRIPASAAHPAFCVDATEVTLAQYRVFMSAIDGGFAAEQPSACSWNVSFGPLVLTGPGDHPVRGVDWCDGYAFCRWSGKRLCGRVTGGALDEVRGEEAGESEWYAACSHDGERRYPYGDAFSPSACVIKTDATHAVASSPACVGGYDGLFDMSGNVYEWEDSCIEGETHDHDTCHARGGSHADIPGRVDAAYSCGRSATYVSFRSNQAYDIGFRCCAN